jgi:hypothetical protein
MITTHALNSPNMLKMVVPSVLVLLAAVLPNACGNEPDTRCGIETVEAIAVYKPTGMPKDLMPGACAMLGGLPVDTAVSQGSPDNLAVGLEEYLPSPADPNQDSEHRSMAIKPEWLGERIQAAQAIAAGDPTQAALATYPYANAGAVPPSPPDQPDNKNHPYSWGPFDQFYPDSNGICTAKLTDSDVTYPAYPDGMGGMVAETHVTYSWSNVRVVVKTESVGQQIFAHLTLTQDNCQGEYDVSILAPRVHCDEYGPDGGATGKGDQGQCSANSVTNVPTPSGQQLYGSGLPSNIIDTIKCTNVGGDPGNDAGIATEYECLPTKTGP